jgi:2'-5' RNA ligase
VLPLKLPVRCDTARSLIHRHGTAADEYAQIVPADRPQSGLVVVVPEAEPVVGRLRMRLDENAPLGVPAHVTVLFPFVPPEQLDDTALRRVARALDGVPAFDHTFSRTAWFGDDVVWLAPDDPEPFRDLTRRVHTEFPEHPPFEGAFDDVVPHLTIGHRQARARLEAAEREVLDRLPVTGRTSAVTLLAQSVPGGRWSVRRTFPLSVVSRR